MLGSVPHTTWDERKEVKDITVSLVNILLLPKVKDMQNGVNLSSLLLLAILNYKGL